MDFFSDQDPGAGPGVWFTSAKHCWSTGLLTLPFASGGLVGEEDARETFNFDSMHQEIHAAVTWQKAFFDRKPAISFELRVPARIRPDLFIP